MDRELTIAEFEELINLRIHMVSLQSQGVVYEKNKISDIKLKYTVAANKILLEHGITELKAIYRGGKAFIIFKPTGRIACEIAADGIYEKEDIRQDRPILLSKYGYIRAKTLQGLIDSTARKGKTVYSGLKRKEIYARRNQSQGNGRS